MPVVCFSKTNHDRSFICEDIYMVKRMLLNCLYLYSMIVIAPRSDYCPYLLYTVNQDDCYHRPRSFQTSNSMIITLTCC